MSRTWPEPLATSGIGSLPHTQRELAVQFALSVDVPYAPQLPQSAVNEFMIPQALDGLPGLVVNDEGGATIDATKWNVGKRDFERIVRTALASGTAFEPDARAWAAWKPFLWEVGERKLPFAKIQMAGPVTVGWACKTTDGEPLLSVLGLGQQINQLILARLLSMTRAVQGVGAQPLVFLDEPGLFAVDVEDPAHRVVLQELGVIIRALRKAGALVGMHCCSNTYWGAILELELDYLAIDATLSLMPLLNAGPAVKKYIARGGRLALGIIPTDVDTEEVVVEDLVDTAMAALTQHEHNGGAPVAETLRGMLLTPACGVALRTLSESEEIFASLRQAQVMLRRFL